MRQDAFAFMDGEELYIYDDMYYIQKTQESQAMMPITILDRETVELIEDALESCITMGVPEKDAKIQAALKALRGEK